MVAAGPAARDLRSEPDLAMPRPYCADVRGKSHVGVLCVLDACPTVRWAKTWLVLRQTMQRSQGVGTLALRARRSNAQVFGLKRQIRDCYEAQGPAGALWI